MSSRKLPEGSWTPVGFHLTAKAARKLTLGGSGGALGTLLAVLGAVLKPLEASWGVPGRSWAPREGRFGTSQEPIWTFWTVFVALRETFENIVFYSVFELPGLPGGVQNCSKIILGDYLDVSWEPRSVWRAQVEAHGAQVEVLRAVLDPMLRYKRPPELTGTRAKYFRSGQNTV